MTDPIIGIRWGFRGYVQKVVSEFSPGGIFSWSKEGVTVSEPQFVLEYTTDGENWIEVPREEVPHDHSIGSIRYEPGK